MHWSEAKWNFAQDQIFCFICGIGQLKDSAELRDLQEFGGGNEMNFCSPKRLGNMQQNIPESPP